MSCTNCENLRKELRETQGKLRELQRKLADIEECKYCEDYCGCIGICYKCTKYKDRHNECCKLYVKREECFNCQLPIYGSDYDTDSDDDSHCDCSMGTRKKYARKELKRLEAGSGAESESESESSNDDDDDETLSAIYNKIRELPKPKIRELPYCATNQLLHLPEWPSLPGQGDMVVPLDDDDDDTLIA